MKKIEISQMIFFTAVILFLAVNGLSLFLLPQHDYSENENRYLTTFQPPSLAGFLDTSMQENLTNGSNDQFAGRDLWMQFAASMQICIGFKDLGGVYIGRDGYYFEKILDSSISENRFLNNLRYIEQFAAGHDTKVTFMPVPSKGTVLKNLLPANAVIYNADRLFHSAKTELKLAEVLDIRKDLGKAAGSMQIYFKTDHHWTMEAAYIAYSAWQHSRSIKNTALAQFSPEFVSGSFYGTLYSKAPYYCALPDRLFIPKKLPEAQIWTGEKESDSIYDFGKLDTKDKYGVYFGGNFARIDIQMQSARRSNSKKLLIIKDSFANSIVPFFMYAFDEITMIDLRYFNESLDGLVEELCPNETLILYEMSNFAQDMNFFKILK